MAFILDPNQPAPAAGAGGATDVIKDADTASFVQDVVEASMQVPVIVDFWAPWCGPCKQMGPILEKQVTQAGGLVRLVKVNVDENQALAAQLRVQSIPTVYAFLGGQPVDAFVGAQPESRIRAFVDQLTRGADAPLEQVLEQGRQALAGDAAAAAQIFHDVLSHDTTNPGAVAGLIRSLVAAGRSAEARQFVDGLDRSLAMNGEVSAAVSAVDLAEQGGGDEAGLRRRLTENPADHQARYDLATALYGSGAAESAIDELLELVRRDRTWNEDAARLLLVKIFDALGPGHPLTAASRRKLSSILFS